MAKKKLNIFITGASGFIGKNLVEYLLSRPGNKYQLFYPYHKELELLDTLGVRDYVSDNRIDVIIHCAKVGGSRKTGYDEKCVDTASNNLRMFFNLENTLSANRQMIFLGTGSEYDFEHYKPKMREDYFGENVPQDAYGFSKFICSKYLENSKKRIINLRPFGVFGKFEDYECRFISNSILKNLFEMPITINQNVFFDYLFVSDLVRVIERFIDKKCKYKFYNVARGKTIDLLTIANKINKVSQKPSQIIVKNPGLNAEYSADNRRLSTELKDFAFTPFDAALKELYAWYRGQLKNIDRKRIAADEYFQYCRTRDNSE